MLSIGTIRHAAALAMQARAVLTSASSGMACSSAPALRQAKVPNLMAHPGCGLLAQATPLRMFADASTTPKSPRPSAAAAGSPTPTSSGAAHTRSIVDIIMDEHRHVEDLYNEYRKPTAPLAAKEVLAWHIIRELSMHAAKEEMVLYPEIRDKLGDKQADHCLAEHQELKVKLDELDSLDPNTTDFRVKLADAMKAFLRHSYDEEERDLLPALMRAPGMDEGRLMYLGERYKEREKIAPTRPHPMAPNKPPLNEAANTTAVPLDMAKDAVRFGTANPPDPLSPSHGKRATASDAR